MRRALANESFELGWMLVMFVHRSYIVHVPDYNRFRPNKIALETYRVHFQRHHCHRPAMTIRFYYNLHCCRARIYARFDVLPTSMAQSHSSKSFVFSSKACVHLCCFRPSSSLAQFHFRHTYANSDPQRMLLVDWSAFSLVIFEYFGKWTLNTYKVLISRIVRTESLPHGDKTDKNGLYKWTYICECECEWRTKISHKPNAHVWCPIWTTRSTNVAGYLRIFSTMNDLIGSNGNSSNAYCTL